MPVQEITTYAAWCDECDWNGGHHESRLYAEDLLDAHIRDVH